MTARVDGCHQWRLIPEYTLLDLRKHLSPRCSTEFLYFIYASVKLHHAKPVHEVNIHLCDSVRPFKWRSLLNCPTKRVSKSPDPPMQLMR